MKKAIFKNLFAVLLVSVSFLFIGLNQANAQTSPDIANDPNSLPSGNFVNVDQAQVLLMSAMIEQKGQLAILPVGSAIYNATEKQYLYYRAISDNITAGSAVPQAIVSGLTVLTIIADPGNVTSLQTLLTLKDDAIQLLSS